jgi:drug/metabolite transporter (DMT)-like permease
MSAQDSDTLRERVPLSGLSLAAIAVVMFSGTVPATRLAVQTIDPTVVGVGRSVLGAVLAVAYLVAIRAQLPRRDQIASIVIVALGAGVGFGWFTSQALRTVSATHGSIVIGLLPAVTAVFGVMRTRARPRPLFWLATACGTAVVVGYALSSGRTLSIGAGDVLLLAALVLAAAAYAEGGRLAQSMPGGQVIAWGLVAALPLSVPLTIHALANAELGPSLASAAALGYMAVFSVFVGMVLWYRAMALAGVPRVSTVQLAQPLLSVAVSWLVLGESLRLSAVVAAVLVLACVGVAQRARFGTAFASQPRPLSSFSNAGVCRRWWRRIASAGRSVSF